MLSSSSEGEFTTWPLVRTALASQALMTWRAKKSMKMLNRRGERRRPCLTPVRAWAQPSSTDCLRCPCHMHHASAPPCPGADGVGGASHRPWHQY